MSYINLSSRDRTSGTQSNGLIKLASNRRLNGSYRLSEFIMNNNIYGIDASNNQVYFTETTPRIYAIPEGSYTADELIPILKAGMEGVSGGTFTITYNVNTNKFNFVCDVNFSFTFGTNTANSARKVLGFNAADTSSSMSIDSVNPIELNKHKIIYFSIPEAGQNMYLSNNTETTFAISDQSLLGEVLRENFNDQQILLKFVSKSCINYKIHDENGDEIRLNNTDWDLILIVD